MVADIALLRPVQTDLTTAGHGLVADRVLVAGHVLLAVPREDHGLTADPTAGHVLAADPRADLVLTADPTADLVLAAEAGREAEADLAAEADPEAVGTRASVLNNPAEMAATVAQDAKNNRIQAHMSAA